MAVKEGLGEAEGPGRLDRVEITSQNLEDNASIIQSMEQSKAFSDLGSDDRDAPGAEGPGSDDLRPSINRLLDAAGAAANGGSTAFNNTGGGNASSSYIEEVDRNLIVDISKGRSETEQAAELA